MHQPVPTCLVIADISGYTGYLSSVELDHAQDILADLIGTVVRSLKPGFRLAKLEGDAAFVYAAAEQVDGQLLMETIDRTYFAFRRRLREIRQASSCECNACRRSPDLDLKFLVHHGLVAFQRMAGREELVGADVIVAHRLLKNEIVESTGIAAYAAYTAACLAAAGLDAAALPLQAHRQAYEHVGEVEVWVEDLHAAWEAEQERSRVVIGDGETLHQFECVLPASPPVAWEAVTSPRRRALWQGADRIESQVAGGRRGVGTVNHCVHGQAVVLEEILDWRPFDYYTVSALQPLPGAPRMLMQWRFEPVEDGQTLLTVRIARPRSAKDRAWLAGAAPMLTQQFDAGLAGLQQLLAADAARQPGADVVSPLPEPPLPAAAGRFASEPVQRG